MEEISWYKGKIIAKIRSCEDLRIIKVLYRFINNLIG